MHKKREKPQRLFSQGRGDRTRTCDSLVPNQERYQLRYTSVAHKKGLLFESASKVIFMTFLHSKSR